MRRFLAVLLLLASCGGSTEPESSDWGYWGGFDARPPGTFQMIAPRTVDETATLAQQARAEGKRPWLIVWPLIWREDSTRWPDWRERIAQMVAACRCDYYLFDEPGLRAVYPEGLAEVAQALPGVVALSLSTPELDRRDPIPAGVTLLGANLYAGAGVTPQQGVAYLDRLASYGKPVYLNLDAFAFGNDCAAIPEQTQARSIALNTALVAWARAHGVRTYVAFLWQVEPQGGTLLCGASSLPVLGQWINQLFGATK